MDQPTFLVAVLLLMCGPSNSIAEETSTWGSVIKSVGVHID
jgi:hypothetical protein